MPILSASDSLISGQTQGTACTNGGKPTYSYTDGTLNNAQQPDWGITDVEVPWRAFYTCLFMGRKPE